MLFEPFLIQCDSTTTTPHNTAVCINDTQVCSEVDGLTDDVSCGVGPPKWIELGADGRRV